jgi:heat shock protein HtpX
MAMDFWEAQRKARLRTAVFLILFVILTAIVSGLIEVALRYFAGEDYQPSYPIAGLVFAGLTFLIAGFQYLAFSVGGGSLVATSLGARQVDPNTSDFKVQTLLNIVQEMALAAHQPVPPVFILDAHQINAFAAGLSPDKAAITVTRGALTHLNRDELQGVIGHEFSHVANGDMLISMRLAALLMGFFFVLYLGLRIFQFSAIAGGRRDNNRRGGNPIMLAALLFVIGGAITWFFGSILKAAISRQREYLADASAVQYTRNPNGIAGALRKIAHTTVSDMPSTGDAYSHLYFDDRSWFSSLFATHPPIEKRIAAIEGIREGSFETPFD